MLKIKDTKQFDLLLRRFSRLVDEALLEAPELIIKNELRLIRDGAIELLDMIS